MFIIYIFILGWHGGVADLRLKNKFPGAKHEVL